MCIYNIIKKIIGEFKQETVGLIPGSEKSYRWEICHKSFVSMGNQCYSDKFVHEEKNRFRNHDWIKRKNTSIHWKRHLPDQIIKDRLMKPKIPDDDSICSDSIDDRNASFYD